MAIMNTTQFANRYGLNIEIFASTDAEMKTALMTIDFANVSDISLSGDRTWATGGQDHANKIGFNNPIEGTFKLSTQIMTMELLNLMAGGTPGASTSRGVSPSPPRQSQTRRTRRSAPPCPGEALSGPPTPCPSARR